MESIYNHTYLFIIILVIAVVVFAAVAPLVKHRLDEKGEQPSGFKYQYKIKTHLMTRAEEHCFVALERLFGEKYYIAPQVHLSALFEHRISGQSWRGAFSHINGKSVDYVLLDKESLKPRCAVELDDSSHNTDERRARDAEVERIFDKAGFPLVRIKNFSTMSDNEIVELFKSAIQKYD